MGSFVLERLVPAPVGRIVDALVLRRHLIRLIARRNATLAARAVAS
jgi:hypothetical protein